MRAALANIVLAVILAGCAGTLDHLNQIKGTAPEDGSCSIVVLEGGTANILSTQQVRGNFSVGFNLGSDYPRKVDVTGVCNGKTVKMLRNIVPGSIGTTELGAVTP
jgi:hypothetical protein